MESLTHPGLAVVLNGVPRSGKSTIAAEMMRRLDDGWTNLGVDSAVAATPSELLPGIGLRPGGERPDLEPFVRQSYETLFDAVADLCRAGGKVVVDVGIHDDYTRPLHIWGEMLSRLGEIRIRTVGVHCSLDVLRQRRAATGYLSWREGHDVPPRILRWQQAVHAEKHYDLKVDTSRSSAHECVSEIIAHI